MKIQNKERVGGLPLPALFEKNNAMLEECTLLLRCMGRTKDKGDDP